MSLLHRVALILGWTLGGSVVQAADWTQWRGPNRNGISAETGLPASWTPGPGGSGNVVWRQATNVGRASETSPGALDAGSPVVVGSGRGGRVFFMHSVQSNTSSRTLCLRDSDGAFQWDYLTRAYGGDGFGACPNHQGAASPYADASTQRLYTGTKEGRLLCLDFEGNLIWGRLTMTNTGGEDPTAFGVSIHNCGNATPVVDGSNVIFPLCAGRRATATDPKLVALNRASGITVWTQTFNPFASPRNSLIHGSWSAPFVATTPDGVRRIFYQLGDGSMRCVRASSGSLLWTHEDDSGFPSAHGGIGQEGVSAPVYNPPGTYEVASGAVYASAGVDPSQSPSVGLGRGRVWKLNAQTGDKIWHYPASNNDLGNVIAAVGISGDRLYIGDTAGYLHCLNIADGTRFWRQSLGGGDIWASATIADGKVYLGTQDGDFYILEDSAAFKVLDQDNVGSEIGSSVAVANGAIYVKCSQYVFKVADAGAPLVESISLTQPVGGETWTEGNSATIAWSATGIANVKIELSRDGGTSYEELAASAPAAAGSWTWPAITTPASAQCMTRISDAADGSPVDVSPSFFTIAGVDAAGPVILFTVLGIDGAVNDPTMAGIVINGTSVGVTGGAFRHEESVAAAPSTITLSGGSALVRRMQVDP